MKFGAAVPVANDTRFLPAVLGQLLKVCDRVVLLRSTYSFSGKSINLRPLPPLDPRVEIIEKHWEDEGATRNAGMDILSDCEYVFIVDADEIFTTDTLKYLKNKVLGHRALACFLHTYWKTPQYEIDPPERICATVLIHKDVRFRFMRVIEGEPHILGQQLMHHLSYVRTNEELKEKLSLFAHAHQISHMWYERVWEKWESNKIMTNLHPIHPQAFGIAKEVHCDELQNILDEFGVK